MAETGTPSAVIEPAGTGVQHSYDVLILDASTKQSLACVRSLGRIGLRVAVGECASECDPAGSALAFHSRYAARSLVLPSVAADPGAFAAEVVSFVRRHRVRVVIPANDGAIMALIPCREQLCALGCTLALASDAALDVANDKDRTLEVAQWLGIGYPRTMRIDRLDDLPAVVKAFQFPFVLKPTVSFPPEAPARLQVVDVIDEVEAVSAIRAFQSAGAGVLAQPWASGRREGVSLLMVGGEVRAACAHVAHRTSPALGGASVLRESIPLLEDIYDPAVRLVREIGLEGACEVEFRRDAAGRPLLMEVNARLAGTIENALHSGVDLPLMLWQWASGQPVSGPAGYRIGVRTRWLHGDMRWLRDNRRRAGRPDSVSRTRALATFAAEFLRSRHLDCVSRGDLRPALAELRATARAVLKPRH
ncbi:MAG TPA: ATP-grasp domain-containing protein [Streptosporangiaceae bacterium]